jgi:leucyl aminopeptidase
MDVRVVQGQIQQEESDLIVVNLFQDETVPAGALKAVDQALGGMISTMLEAGDFKGKLGDTHLVYSRGMLPAPRVLVAGLGPREEFGLEQARRAAAAAARRVRDLGVLRYSTIVHGGGAAGLDTALAAQAVVEGSLLGLYRFMSHKRDAAPEKDGGPQALALVEADASKVDAVREGARVGQVAAEMANLARDLINEPGNYLTPPALARRLRAQAETIGVEAKVLGEDELATLGAGSFLAVAQGSEEEAQFIILEHRPQGLEDGELPTVVLVGKAITFDTGGISLKPAENMWQMKDDMGGGAAVAGAVLAAARLNLPVHAVALIPSCDNMPSGRALKPGDVVRAMNGKTIEIISTDAEGRQILADALCYAARYNPVAVVDVATLTGSIGLALGRQVAGVFCDDADLRGRLLKAGELAGEALWPMPLHKPYRKLIDTDVADMKNSGGRYGGAIIGALFLQEFAEGYPWAHLDIASTVWQEENTAFAARGGTGFGTRLLLELLRGYA